jgi:hypothetical protein
VFSLVECFYGHSPLPSQNLSGHPIQALFAKIQARSREDPPKSARQKSTLSSSLPYRPACSRCWCPEIHETALERPIRSYFQGSKRISSHHIQPQSPKKPPSFILPHPFQAKTSFSPISDHIFETINRSVPRNSPDHARRRPLLLFASCIYNLQV